MATSKRVIVCVDPPAEPGKVWERQVEWFPDWQSAVAWVDQLAHGDDPGTVTILSLPPEPER